VALAFVAGLFTAPTHAADAKGTVTYAKDVAPILMDKCQSCHRPGQVAPMSLLTYEEARPWARAIRTKVQARMMPPWHIDKTVGIQQFKNDISLSDAQIDTIARWVDAGAPLGDPKDMPAAKTFSDSNESKLAAQFGEPELVIKATPYTMDAKTQDKWWKPVTDTGVTDVRWVRAVETRTANIDGRRILHHAVASLIQDEKLVPEQFRVAPGGPHELHSREPRLAMGSRRAQGSHVRQHAAGSQLRAGVRRAAEKSGAEIFHGAGARRQSRCTGDAHALRDRRWQDAQSGSCSGGGADAGGQRHVDQVPRAGHRHVRAGEA